MMRAAFEPPERTRKKVVGICFLLLIMAGWALPLLAAGGQGIAMIDQEPFLQIEQGDYTEGTPSLLYTAFMGIFYGIGANVTDFGIGVLVFVCIQSLLLASVCAWAGFWLYAKGAPLWLALIIVAIISMLVPLSHAVAQPGTGALTVVGLFFLTLKLIDAVADNCGRLRKTGSVCLLFALLALALFLDLSLVVVASATLIAICLTPSRIRGRLLIFAFIAFALCFAALFVAFPLLGWAKDPFAYFREFFIPTIRASYLPALAVTLVALVGVLLNRRPRYLLPFIPLIAFGVSVVFLQPQPVMSLWLYNSAFILGLPFLILIPLTREYQETKKELRERFLAVRAAISDDECATRSELACLTLLNELKELVKPEDGYVGLYSAKGKELFLGRLAVRLGAFGYRVAYPAKVSGTQLSFFTTIGVSDEALLDAFLGRDPFEVTTEADLEGLPRVEISEISALVVPGVVFDKDRYRIGQGEGYYDRYIVQLDREIPVWGIGFREQLVDSVPVEDHDQSLSGVVVA